MNNHFLAASRASRRPPTAPVPSPSSPVPRTATSTPPEPVEWARLHDEARAMAAELQARGDRPGPVGGDRRPDDPRPRHRDPGHVAGGRRTSSCSRSRCAWARSRSSSSRHARRVLNAECRDRARRPAARRTARSDAGRSPDPDARRARAGCSSPRQRRVLAAGRRPRRAGDPAVHEWEHRRARRA